MRPYKSTAGDRHQSARAMYRSEARNCANQRRSIATVASNVQTQESIRMRSMRSPGNGSCIQACASRKYSGG